MNMHALALANSQVCRYSRLINQCHEHQAERQICIGERMYVNVEYILSSLKVICNKRVMLCFASTSTHMLACKHAHTHTTLQLTAVLISHD